MKTIIGVNIFVAAALALTGCTKGVARNGQRANNQRVTYTGSNIPQDPNRVTDAPVRATSPSQSFARDNPSLYPTDPVVGANAGPSGSGRTGQYPNTGAGPAGSHPVPGTE